MTKPAILITGGAGYIGSHAAWACTDAGYRVVIVDNLSTGVRKNVPPCALFVEADISDLSAIRNTVTENDVTAILHFAGSIVVPESVENPALYYHNNTSKTLALAKLAADLALKAFIFSSTAAVYAQGPAEPLREDSPKTPLNPYGWSKLMSEQMLADISKAHGLPVGILRYFNVAGADLLGRTGQSTPNATHLIKVACEVAIGKRPMLSIFGTDYETPDGTCIRDYIHVNDLADAHVHLLDYLLQGKGNLTANCGYGRGSSVQEVVSEIEAVIGSSLPVRLEDKRPGDAAALIADSDFLQSSVPWKPKYANLRTIIESALAWERHLTA